jgi:hypothetical protein
MTAVATPAVHRIATTARIHMANPWNLVFTPWLVLLAVFGLNFAIWHAVIIAADGRPLSDAAFVNNGGAMFVLVYMVVVAVQAMNQTFSFVVGLGATRRDYFFGTSAIFSALSAMFGVGLALLVIVERATDGWGVGGAFFSPGPLRTVPVWELAVIYTLLLLLMFFVGSAVAAMFVRWGSTGIIVFFTVLAVLLVAVIYGISVTDGWGAVGRFLADRSYLELVVLTLPLTVAGGLTGFALMRKATPKG